MNEWEPAESDRAKVADIVVEAMAVGAVGAEVGAVIGGPVGGLAGGVTTGFLTALAAIRRSRTHRGERVVDLAGITFDQLASWLDAEPARQGLFVTVVEAAARSTAEAHLDALARVLADGASDDARIDVDTLIGRAIGDLGPAHLQVLVFLRREDRDAGERVSQHSTDALAIEMPHLGEGMASLVATLTATGCVAIEAGGFGGGPTGYRITIFGRACLGFFHDRASGPTTDSAEG